MGSYISGTLVRTSATFLSVTGVPTAPSTVTLKINRGGTTTTPAPVTDGTGAYHYDIDTSGWSSPQPELVTVEWIGTGAVQAIQADQFYVTAALL